MMVREPLDASGAPVAIRFWQGNLQRRRSSARHAFTVLAFHVSGDLEVEHGGALTLRAGDVHVIPAGHAHRVTRGADVEFWAVGFAPSRLDAERFASVLAPLDAITRGAQPRVVIPEERRLFVSALYGELARERARSPLRGESLLALLLDEVATHASRAELAVATDSHSVDERSDLAARAISFIATHALGSLTLADVASALGRNRTHVADVVRRATGQTVGEIIAEVRLDEARRRLEETDELVEVIGERVGYVDPTHFARTFKRRFGLTPRAWRNHH